MQSIDFFGKLTLRLPMIGASLSEPHTGGWMFNRLVTKNLQVNHENVYQYVHESVYACGASCTDQCACALAHATGI